MPVTCGSVGDIIALTKLIKELVEALNDSRGAAHDFRKLVRQLQSLGSVLQEVHLLLCRHEPSPGLDALRASTIRVAAGCQESAEEFLAQVRKYQQSLREGGSGRKIVDGVRKVQWRLLKKEDAQAFQSQLLAQTSSLQTLVELWNITINEQSHATTQRMLEESDTTARTAEAAQQGFLSSILSRIDESMDVSRRTYIALSAVYAASQRAWLLRFGEKLTAIMSRIQACTFDSYSLLLSINTKLSYLINERYVSLGTCLLTDALGREFRFHLELINSWGAFDAIMEYHFRCKPGHRKIQAKEFCLLDSRTQSHLNRSDAWRTIVKAGQPLQMAMEFHNNLSETHMSTCFTCSQALLEPHAGVSPHSRQQY
ncbi:MAG: hypothetical protein Q9159_002407 [Coniocarpon cinnabarinum]